MRRSVDRKQYEAESYHAWNAFIDLIANEEIEDLTPVQRVAHHAFWYESEVQNGGHLQYFENRGIEGLKATIIALDEIGGLCQKKVLETASKKWSAIEHTPITSVLEYSSTALEDEFDTEDSRYHNCSPDMNTFLQAYLEKHFDEFIELI